MPPKKQEPTGCGCANIPLFVIVIILGGGYWLFSPRDNIDFGYLWAKGQEVVSPLFNKPSNQTPISTATPTPSLNPTPLPIPSRIPSLNPTPIASKIPTTALSIHPNNQQDAIKKK
jgi:hypothetical protein